MNTSEPFGTTGAADVFTLLYGYDNSLIPFRPRDGAACLQSHLSSPAQTVLQQLQWQMGDERGSWKDGGVENSGGENWKEAKGTGVNLSNRKGGGNVHIGLQRGRSMDRFSPFTLCFSTSTSFSDRCRAALFQSGKCALAWRKRRFAVK